VEYASRMHKYSRELVSALIWKRGRAYALPLGGATSPCTSPQQCCGVPRADLFAMLELEGDTVAEGYCASVASRGRQARGAVAIPSPCGAGR
jgi:hypothetical protein